MSFSLTQILLFIVVYLSGLFGVAYLADRGIIPDRITRHPAVYVLSLGVFAGALASNGIFVPANNHGSAFLLYYLGVVLMFILAPLLLMPLLRLCRVYQLASLADVLTFRFRSHWVGASITVAMCLTLLPLLALQIQAVADSIHILAGDASTLLPGRDRQDGLALLFCIIITIFSILFGTRHISAHSRNTGLVTAIAFESLVKLTAMLILFLVAVFQVFDGFGDLAQWLQQRSTVATNTVHSMQGAEARAMLLLFFAGAVCMPHIFHMAFAENTESQDLRTASWGLPLYLLLLSLPVLPILWAGMKLGHSLPVEYSGLAIGMGLHSTTISAIAFVAGLSASSATIIITTLALANMCLNHLVLPGRVLQIDGRQNIYRQLKWLRRTLITVLIMCGYGFFVALNGRQSLSQLGLAAFIGTLQFLPGIVVTLYWRGANRKGLLAGLTGGLLVWFFSVLLPVTGSYEPAWLDQFSTLWVQDSEHLWAFATVLSLGLNGTLLFTISVFSRASPEERIAAEICSTDDLSRPVRQTLDQQNSAEFTQQLTAILGEKTAEAEVRRALQQLQFNPDENRPYALRRLRNRIEANLSGLLGPTVAQSIINRALPFQPSQRPGSEDINLIEQNLDQSRVQFTGMAADLDNLRRHYRETLNNLPIGVCSIGMDGELVMWNRNMEAITGTASNDVLGSHLDSLTAPWRDIIGDFLAGEVDTVLKKEVSGDGDPALWISLHKTSAQQTDSDNGADRVILVEDITGYELLEEELLHNERLASIGRLAAGVAHEIGNPVTGIACLAQNLAFETEPEEIQHTAQDILKQTDRVTRIVQSLVNFSHSGSSTGNITLVPCNLADCVDESIHLLQLDHQATQVQFSNQCDRELLVLADGQRLLQVFINLLSNARDACDDNGIAQISAHWDDNRVEIQVQDNGCGIPSELQSQIFEPFYTTKDPGAGTGLGLALVYSIMEDMGGSIALQSPVGDDHRPGSRFTLLLARSSYGQEFEV